MSTLPSVTEISNSKASRIQHFDFIDALRGIAFLAVLVVHTAIYVKPLPDFFRHLTNEGMRGAQLFFILSSFTLFHSFDERRRKEKRPALNFFVRRFFRIAPLFWFGIILYLFLNGFRPRYYAPEGIHFFDIILTLFFLHAWWPNAINSVVPGGWTIGVEMMFYLLLPLFFRFIRSLKAALLLFLFSCPIALILSLNIQHFLEQRYPLEFQAQIREFAYFWLPDQLPIFFLGFILYFILKSHFNSVLEDKKKKRDLFLARGLLFFSLFLFVACVKWEYRYFPNHFVYGILFFLLTWSQALVPAKGIVNRISCYLGKISFSGYLMQFAALRVTEHFLRHWAANPILLFFEKFALNLAFTAFLATITYTCIEIPGIRLGKKIVSRIEQAY